MFILDMIVIVLGSFFLGMLFGYFYHKFFVLKKARFISPARYLVLSVGELVLGEGIPYNEYEVRIQKAIEKWNIGNYRELIILTPEPRGRLNSAVNYVKLLLEKEETIDSSDIKVFYETCDPPSYALGRWDCVENYSLRELLTPLPEEEVYMGVLAVESQEEGEEEENPQSVSLVV